MKVKLGMIGGGPGSFIGAVHRRVAALDGQYELVCGAFSSDPEKSRQTGEELYLDPERVYGSYDEMIQKEKELPADRRMNAVAIVTPNHVHFDPAQKALKNGYHVVLDKPMTFSLQEAKELKKTVEESGRLLAVTYTYTGYPMVKEAREIVASGKLGKVRKIYVEYPQGFLAKPVEKEGHKQFSWRTDPKRSGAGGTVGDIGTHAFNLAEFVSGLRVSEICGELNALVEGRRLDDDATALLKFENGATGVLMASQAAAGDENDLKIRVYGEEGGVSWAQADANSLYVKMLGQPVQIHRTGHDYVSAAAAAAARVPQGHPEGYLEAFANLYVEFARAVRDQAAGKFKSYADYEFPVVDEGVRGMAFIETMVASAKTNEKWTKLEV